MDTVTVLYFCSYQILTMQKAVLKNPKMGKSGRVILDDAFREGKTIIAVIEGDVNVLNMTGERVGTMTPEQAEDDQACA